MHDNIDTLPCFETFVNFRLIDVFFVIAIMILLALSL